MRRSSVHAIQLFVSVGFAAVVACSGSAAPGISPGGDVDAAGATDGSSTTDGSTNTDGAPPDAAEPDTSTKDAGIVVTEKPAPDCNDLAQFAMQLAPTGNASAAPAPVPGVTIAPGLYVATAIIDYDGTQPVQTARTATTVVFTAAKQYYVRDDSNGTHQVLTLDWKIEAGKLVRNVLCSQSPISGPISYRIGASANGFTVFVDNLQPGNRTETVRYDRVP